MKVVFYGNKQAGMIGLLTVLALGHRVIEVWQDYDNLPQLPGVIYKTIEGSFPGTEGDLLLCVHGRRIIPDSVLRQFKHGGINLHPFLDKYPGADPVGKALLNKETTASVYAHQMTAAVDCGEVIASYKTDMPQNASAGDVYNKLYPLYVETIVKVFDSL